jgi:hypothetical protein
VAPPANVESVIAALPDGEGGSHLWKLSHYYDRLDEWEATHGVAPAARPGAAAPAEPQWELYDLTADPEERHNAWGAPGAPISELGNLLSSIRHSQRLGPQHRS